MTDIPTYAEMRAHGERSRAWDVRRKERGEQDGFLIEQWNEDGDVFGCLGHVDRDAFLTQWRWIYTAEGDPGALDDVTTAQVEHRYVLVDPDEGAEYLSRWAIERSLPRASAGYEAVFRAVTVDDPGAEPVTMLDL
jgi:hypothetical protein